MTDTTDVVEDAEQEAQEAAALAEALADRIRDGDESVTPEELSNAEGLRKFAELKVQAAQRKVGKLKKAAALKRAKAFVEELHGFVDVDAELVEAWTESVRALRRLEELAVRRSDSVRDISGNVQRASEELRRDADTDLAKEFGILPGRWANQAGFQIPAKGVEVSDVELSRLLASVAHEALGDYSRMQMAAAINSREPALEKSVLGQSIEGWPEAIRDVKDA